MKKKALVLMAALAVMCCSASAFAAAGTCQDWLGTWSFQYDNATATNTKICFDNSSLFNHNKLVLSDNDSEDNITCLDNNTKAQFCVDNTTGLKCDNASKPDCTCFTNPYKLTKGKKEVKITDVSKKTFEGKSSPCVATGKRGTDNITIVQPNDNITADLGITKLTYIVFEGASFDNITFAQIAPDNFTKTATSVNFKSKFNFTGLVSGTRTLDNGTDNISCELKVWPKNFSMLTAILDPIQIFYISGGTDFAKPVKVDWGYKDGEKIDDFKAIWTLTRIRLGKKSIFGVILVRPFQLKDIKGENQVFVTYGDKEGCAPYTVK